jgi:nitrogen fixation NifU-like protein
LDHPDAEGQAKNEADGDQVLIHLKIENRQIVEAKMKVMGCVAAIASTSLMTELITGLSVEEAKAFSKEQLTEALGGLPENKIRCSLTCIDALHQALDGVE